MTGYPTKWVTVVCPSCGSRERELTLTLHYGIYSYECPKCRAVNSVWYEETIEEERESILREEKRYDLP